MAVTCTLLALLVEDREYPAIPQGWRANNEPGAGPAEIFACRDEAAHRASILGFAKSCASPDSKLILNTSAVCCGSDTAIANTAVESCSKHSADASTGAALELHYQQ
jgi:hypothetical protein